MITVWVVLLLILVSGLLVLCQRREGSGRVFRTMRRCLDLVVFRVGVGVFFRVGVGVFFRVQYKNRSHVPLYFRSKRMKRHVSRTHRVNLAWFFDQITWDPGPHIRYGNTNQQIADIFDQRFSRHRWLQLTQLFNLMTLASYDSHLSVLISSVPCNSNHLMAKRLGESSDEHVAATQKLDRCIIARWRKENPPKSGSEDKGDPGASTWRNPVFTTELNRSSST